MSNSRFTVPVVVFLILIKDNKVLLTRRQNTNWCDGSYDMPSGHIEGNETLVEAVCREAKEEISITVDPKDAKFTAFFHPLSDGKEYLYVAFEATRWRGEPRIGEPDKCDDIRWFPLNDLPENITPGTRDILKAYASKTIFAESGFDS